MHSPQVTIVVVPRERFSCTQTSLESIYEHATFPFKLVYVDGNSPTKVRRYLETMASEKDFTLIRTDYYLSPNHARNIGLSYVDTKYVVFFDNDVVVTPGWLEALVSCAQETGAAVVGPLMCEKEPLHQRIHFAAGECHIVTDVNGKRHLREKMYKQGQQVSEVGSQLQRTQTELTEFHLMLATKEICDRVGGFDEGMLNTKEHLDFCMMVTEAGETIYFEPASIATYVPGPPLERTDLHFFMLRWSDAWTLGSLNRLQEKWNLADDGYFKNKYKKLGWRRKNTIVKPISKSLSFGIGYKPLKELMFGWEKVLNRYLTNAYDRQYLQLKKEQV
ncbi:MAG: glycosyltransferase [Cyanosarcina radialis HA8281-LM2]|jgi:GT2 family glycosyltransferase|nr:glycosyltransferase [Cyanosarcina radialis HA8281-LM2]